jgi:protein-disulfide isomerase
VTEAYQRRLFEQKTFEGFDWVNLARTTGVPDVNSFRACLAGDQSANVIRLDVEEGKRLKVASTPTIIINGEILHGAVTSDQLEATYTDALRRQPSR